MKAVTLLLMAALALAACGKRGSPQPVGPQDQVTYPRIYPSR